MERRKLILTVLSILFFTTGFFYYVLTMKSEEAPPKEIVNKQHAKIVQKETVDLYVPDEELQRLIIKETEVDKGRNAEEEIKIIFEALKNKMNNSIQYSPEIYQKKNGDFIDKEAKVLNVYIDGWDVYLNLNVKFKESMESAQQELMVINSIVSSISESGDYRRIKFLIENSESNTLKFHKISEFYERNLEI